MEWININHAYDGFLYAPLFLAEELGVFQKRMRLKYRDGDEATINTLALEDEGRNWFAVCDPFAKDITAVQKAIGPRDQVCIVAAFIHRLPVWLDYCGGAQFSVCTDEADLSTRRAHVDHLSCYRAFNTGFLVGERVRKQLNLSTDKLVTRDFGKEFDGLPSKTIVVTSDILKLVQNGDLVSGKVVFSYAQRVQELNPFLFTAVLTLKSVIDKHLDAVLSVLSGLRLAARGMNEPGNLQSLLGHYTGFDAAHIQKAVGVLTEEDIYSKDFDLEQAASAYEKARIAWQQIKPDTQFAGIEKCREPIPCLLLKDSWHMDKTLVDLLVKEWRTDSELVATARKSLPPVDWWALGIKYYALLAVLLAILAVTGGLVVVHGWKKATAGSFGYWLISAFTLLIQLTCSAVLTWNLMKKKFDWNWFAFLVGAIFTLFFALLAIVNWIVK